MRATLESLLVAGAVATASGCSFIGVRRPPPATTDAPLECTRSRTAPALDTAGAIASPIIGLMVWGLCEYSNSMQSWASDPSRMNCQSVLWGAALSTAAYTGSAVYGFRSTGECRRLTAERSARPRSVGTPEVPDPAWLHDPKPEAVSPVR